MKLLDIINCPYDIEISGITDDSRRVSNNYLFVATKGYNVDHFDYIDDAMGRLQLLLIDLLYLM